MNRALSSPPGGVADPADTRLRTRAMSSKGMALVSVLLVAVVMLGLAGAFFVAHKSDLALMVSGNDREQTKNACLSVADFVQYKLQNDRTFGKQASAGTENFPDGSSNPTLTATYSSTGGGPNQRNFIHGEMPESQVKFDVEILNNLDGKLPLTITERRNTPPRSCRVWISSTRRNVTQNIDLIFKRSPFTNASIVSGKDINVELTHSEDGAWWLGARQPSGNSVRASGKINGPEVWSPTGRAVLFTPPPGMESRLDPPYGVLQGESLTMQVDGVPTQLMTGEDVLEESEENIRGVLSPGGGNVLVPELNRDDLQGPAQKVTLPDAKLVFKTQVGTDGQTIHVLEGDNGILASYDPLAPDTSRFFTWADTPARDAVVIDLETRVMTVSENVELQTGERDFELRSVTPSGKIDTTRQPTLYLGSNDKGAALDARTIDIEGSVGGQGALKSQSDLKIAAKSYLSTTPDFGIALHAQQDVVLTKPGTNSTDGLAVDWEAYAEGYDASSSNDDLDRWAELNEDDRRNEAALFKTRKLATHENPDDFDEVWDGLTADLPADNVARRARNEWLKPPIPAVMGPDPSWTPAPVPEPEPGVEPPAPEEPPIIELEPGVAGGPGIDIDKYVRLREYLRTVKSEQPDPSWLDEGEAPIRAQRRADVLNLVNNQLSTFQLQAGQVSRQVDGQLVLEWKKLDDYFEGSNPYLASYTPDMVFRGLIYAGRDFLFDTEKKGVYIEGALVAKGNVTIKDATGARFVYNSELLENLFATDEQDHSVPLERFYWALY